MFVKEYENKKWLLIFYQNIESDEDLFEDDWEKFLLINENNKYSILGLIDSSFSYLYQHKYFYEFLLLYPELEGHNIWRQIINPIFTTVEGENGYQPIDIQWSRDFNGLSKSNYGKSFLDGSRFGESYYYSIGSKTKWCSGIAGSLFMDQDQNCPQTLRKVALFIRININIPKCKTFINNINSLHKFLLIKIILIKLT